MKQTSFDILDHCRGPGIFYNPIGGFKSKPSSNLSAQRIAWRWDTPKMGS
jgi:hypothetical protein